MMAPAAIESAHEEFDKHKFWRDRQKRKSRGK
jgi:hypothetical protein